MDCAYVHTEMGLASARRRGARPFKLMASCALVALLVVAVLAVHIALRAEIVAASARKAAAQARLESLMNEYDRATLELARATSLDRIDGVARASLGMTEPADMAVVLVDGTAAPQATAPAAVESARANGAPTVLAGLTGIVQQLVAAAVSNLVAGWFASAPPELPSVLR